MRESERARASRREERPPKAAAPAVGLSPATPMGKNAAVNKMVLTRPRCTPLYTSLSLSLSLSFSLVIYCCWFLLSLSFARCRSSRDATERRLSLARAGVRAVV